MTLMSATLIAKYGVLVHVFVSVILHTVDARDTNSCRPSSCGNIPNISYPFRLRTDHKNCGNKDYELSCENNLALVLNLFSAKYYVQAINYSNYTIRLVDAGVRADDCSSLSRYVETSPCYNGTYSDGYSYAMVGKFTPLEVMDSCTIELMTVTSLQLADANNISDKDVHRALVYGFELSWSGALVERPVLRGGDPEKLNTPFCSFLAVLLTRLPDPIRSRIRHYLGKHSLQVLFLKDTLYHVALFFIGGPCVVIFLIYKWQRRHLSMYDNIEEFLQRFGDLMPIRYSYSDIKKMTRNFENKLGEGGYGCVYKGKLRSGSFAAVKMLGKSRANGQDFINEVATIGRIHHVNVVRLIGFSVEGSNHALVYDFMSNGSLDKYIFSSGNVSNHISNEKLFEIALGIARGIEYLHRGCNMQILHFDIKPHNILLDENLVPKISDFGLAKLYPTDNNIVSLTAARGTIGYMAPELFYKNIGGISHKADVYSFGMLLLEIAGRRKNFNALAEHSSQAFFPSWIYDQYSKENDMEFADASEEERKITKKMIIVALWCMQFSPNARPSMNNVVEMLEGEAECLNLPPRPYSATDINSTETTKTSNYSIPMSFSVESRDGMVHLEKTRSSY
ncbi:hypothetical protein K2173_018026 [Erythroxylum novogranatense]|uniref:Protein kinase domain-containing protein n=1 Tax=Erythroxylum novogranatense TaxID=1862640 RepID=A0AAV8TXG0_9ROSI|nr:hypothetical protein K2173_018026 [Erythroxylum novogranatense]